MCAQSATKNPAKISATAQIMLLTTVSKKSPTAQSPIPKTAQKVKLKIEGSKDSEKKIPISTAMKTGIQ